MSASQIVHNIDIWNMLIDETFNIEQKWFDNGAWHQYMDDIVLEVFDIATDIEYKPSISGGKEG